MPHGPRALDHGGHARPRAADPHKRRAAHQQLPALADRLCRALVHPVLWPDFRKEHLFQPSSTSRTANGASGSSANSSPAEHAHDPFLLLLIAGPVLRPGERCRPCDGPGLPEGVRDRRHHRERHVSTRPERREALQRPASGRQDHRARPERITDAIKNIWEQKLFSDVRIEAAEVRGGPSSCTSS
jgi:hypothetical protein